MRSRHMPMWNMTIAGASPVARSRTGALYRRTLALPCAALPAPGESVPCQAGFMSIVWVPLNVIGPVRPGVVPPAAMFRVMVASTVPVEWVLTRRWALESIHDVTSDVVVPFMDRLLSAPVEGKSDVPPWPPSADMSSVRSMLLARLDWTTAVLTLLTCSSRTYLFLLVTWTEPVPVGLAWS